MREIACINRLATLEWIFGMQRESFESSACSKLISNKRFSSMYSKADIFPLPWPLLWTGNMYWSWHKCSNIISFSYLRNWIIQFCFALCSCPGERTSKSGECANKSCSAECNTVSLNRHKLDIFFNFIPLCLDLRLVTFSKIFFL